MTNKEAIAGLLSASAMVVALAAPSFAADLPVKAPRLPAPPQLWSGLYVGVHIGGEWTRDRYDTTAFAGGVYQSPVNLGAFSDHGTGHARDTGVIGGAQIGYNWRSGTFVYGIEADFSGLSSEPELVTTGAIPLGPHAGTPSRSLAPRAPTG